MLLVLSRFCANHLSKKFFSLFLVCVTAWGYSDPSIIAHRGGSQNFPENTLLAFEKSLEMGCDGIELDVQVTKDGIVVVYHPDDLKQRTNGSGPISAYKWEEISSLNAGYNFNDESGCSFRNLNLKIPKLEEVLSKFPDILIIVDMKSLPAENLVNALVDAISERESSRIIFYSTNSEHVDLLLALKPHWKTFEKRDITRQRLLELNQCHRSELPLTSPWIGFELKRTMTVMENFSLGKGVSSVDFYLWKPETVSYLKNLNPKAFVVLFGINKKEDWNQAISLSVDAVYTDNPFELLRLKNSTNTAHQILRSIKL